MTAELLTLTDRAVAAGPGTADVELAGTLARLGAAEYRWCSFGSHTLIIDGAGLAVLALGMWWLHRRRAAAQRAAAPGAGCGGSGCDC